MRPILAVFFVALLLGFAVAILGDALGGPAVNPFITVFLFGVGVGILVDILLDWWGSKR